MAEIPIGVFPELGVQWDIAEESSFETEIEWSENRHPQRDDIGEPGGLRSFKASSTFFSDDESETIYAFWLLCRGQVESFYFYPPPGEKKTALQIGTGDGAATTFLTTYKETLVTAAYDDNTGMPVAFAVNAGVGPNGEDEVEIHPAIAAGHKVLIDFGGRPRLLAIFATKSLPWGFIESGDQLRVYVISIQEIPNE